MKYIKIDTNELIEVLAFNRLNEGSYLVELPVNGWNKIKDICDVDHQIALMGQKCWDSLDEDKKYWWKHYGGNLVPDCKILRAMYGIEEEING